MRLRSIEHKRHRNYKLPRLPFCQSWSQAPQSVSVRQRPQYVSNLDILHHITSNIHLPSLSSWRKIMRSFPGCRYVTRGRKMQHLKSRDRYSQLGLLLGHVTFQSFKATSFGNTAKNITVVSVLEQSFSVLRRIITFTRCTTGE